MRMKLNESSIKKLTPPPAGYALCWDEELCGFGLRVAAAGARSFIVEKRIPRSYASGHVGSVAGRKVCRG
jgi:hypothetical protein